MAGKQSKGSTEKSKLVSPGSVDELARILLLQMRYQGVPQGALVHDLSKLGLEPARIAELLGTKGGTVRQQKIQKRPVWPTKQEAG